MLAHLAKRAEIDLQQHRDDHQPDEASHRQIDPRDLRAGNDGKRTGHEMPEGYARDDAQRHPQREIPFEQIHTGSDIPGMSRGALSSGFIGCIKQGCE